MAEKKKSLNTEGVRITVTEAKHNISIQIIELQILLKW